MYYIKELCVKLVTYQKFYRDARSAKYKKKNLFFLYSCPIYFSKLVGSEYYLFTKDIK